MSHPIRALYDNRDTKAARPALFDGEVIVTHAELILGVEAAADDLAARGVRPGDRVGLCARNSWMHVVAYLAVLRAGAVWTPLNPRNGGSLNGAFQARAGLALTLIDAASADAAGPSAQPLDLQTWLEDLTPGALPPIIDDADAPWALRTRLRCSIMTVIACSGQDCAASRTAA